MINKWTGKVWIDDGIAFYLGCTGDNNAHKHNAIQIVLPYEGAISVFDKNNQEIIATRTSGLVIPANTLHRVQSDGQQKIGFIYLEPYSKSGRALMEKFSSSKHINKLTPDVSSACIKELEIIEQGILLASCDTNNIMSLLTGVNAKPLVLDERVKKTIDYINNHLEDIKTLDSLAEKLAISPRYLRRLFGQQVGMSIQRFCLWVKLRIALSHIATGESFTEASHVAGFSDSAHFSRTFSNMFGIAPSEVMGNANKLKCEQLVM